MHKNGEKGGQNDVDLAEWEWLAAERGPLGQVELGQKQDLQNLEHARHLPEAGGGGYRRRLRRDTAAPSFLADRLRKKLQLGPAILGNLCGKFEAFILYI